MKVTRHRSPNDPSSAPRRTRADRRRCADASSVSNLSLRSRVLPRVRCRWAIVVALVLVAAACGGSRSSGAFPRRVPGASVASTAMGVGSASSLPGRGVIDRNEIVTVSFVDSEHGYAALRNGVVAVSVDGGRSWRAAGTPPGSGSGSCECIGVDFTSVADGWAYGAPVARYVTSDGGRTWRDTHPGGSVEALEAIGTSIMSLVGCADSTRCVAALDTSLDGGRTWHRSHLPGIETGTADLDRVDLRTAYVWIRTAGLIASPLLVTHDAGRTWQRRAAPCTPGNGHDVLSVLDVNDLWFACGFGDGVGSGGKAVYRSHDDGRHWLLVARTDFTHKTIGNLPTTGYLSELQAVNDQVALLGLARGSVWVTRDGGHTWKTVIELGEGFPSFDRLPSGSRIFAASGFAFDNSGVWSTTDGIHFPGIRVTP
jgi:photosystem II stability/assembly factor-like uncharacterized protein